MPRVAGLALVAAIAFAAAACDRPTQPAGSAGLAVAASSPPSSAPHGSGAGEKALTPEGARITTANVEFELPANWRREQPSSGMRLAQAVVPGEAGPGELAVFHFGAGKGGGVESNFERWLGQIDQAEGEKPERGGIAAAGFKISWIDARGTLLPSGMGSGPATPQAGFRLVGAVVEGEGGPWFFKVTGPDATLAREREAFFELLRGVRQP